MNITREKMQDAHIKTKRHNCKIGELRKNGQGQGNGNPPPKKNPHKNKTSFNPQNYARQ